MTWLLPLPLLLSTTFAATSTMLAAVWFNRIWYSLPLIVVISLVYAATRHELIRPILEHAVRFGFWIVSFMFIVFLVLTFVTSRL